MFFRRMPLANGSAETFFHSLALATVRRVPLLTRLRGMHSHVVHPSRDSEEKKCEDKKCEIARASIEWLIGVAVFPRGTRSQTVSNAVAQLTRAGGT